MSHRLRLQQFADTVKAAGLAGKSMQDELRKIAEHEDLTAHQIRRVAEIANREVQLALQKTASDKRFSFKLCDPFALTKELQKTAGWQGGDGSEKTASADLGSISDFYADAPVTGSTDQLSLYQAPLDPAFEKQALESRTRELLQTYDQARLELESTLTAAKAAEVETQGVARQVFNRMISDAVEMIMTGVTLPSMWMAITGAVEGSRASDKDRMRSEAVLRLLIEGLKERHVPNYRLGFRWHGDVDALNELDTDDLIALCKRCTGTPQDLGTTMATAKSASRFIETRVQMRDFKGHPYEEAAKHLLERVELLGISTPKVYLDDDQTNNLPKGGVRLVNGDSEFIIAVRDLVGMQDRLLKNHNAQEYLGLKLKEISDVMKGLSCAQSKTSEALALAVAEAEAHKHAMPPLGALLGGAANLAMVGSAAASVMPRSAPKGPKPGETPAPAGAVT